MSKYTIISKLTSAEENALAYRRLRYSAELIVAAPPELDPAKNPLLANEPDDEINQLHKNYQGKELRIFVHQFDQSQDPIATDGFIQLRWNGSLVGEPWRYRTPVPPLAFPFELDLPAEFTTDKGRYELSYRINHGGNTGALVTPLTINIDTDFPAPIKPTVPVTEITKDYLDVNGHVPVTCPLTPDNRIGDVIRAWYGESEADPDKVLIGTQTLVDPITAPVFQLTETMLGGEEGLHEIWTDHCDRKGNQSPASDKLVLDVVLTLTPVLVPAAVPLFEDDGVISLIDAQTQPGVGVGIIDEYKNFVDGRDWLLITWDGLSQEGKLIDRFPFFIDVPFKDVYNGVAYQDDVPVTLQIRRGARLHPDTPLTTFVNKDLRRPGVIDPDKPGPPDDFLPLVIALGAVSQEINHIYRVDENEPVNVHVPLYDGAVANECLQLYWDGVLVPESDGGIYTVTGSEGGDFEVVFSVSWTFVEAQGNNANTLLHYRAYDAVSANYAVSESQSVNVRIHDRVISDPEIQHLDVDFGYLNCTSLRLGLDGKMSVVVFIPPDPAFKDRVVTLEYQAYADEEGLIELPVRDRVAYTISKQETIDGAYVNIPYRVFEETGSAFGAIKYTTVIDGYLSTSERQLVRVLMRDGDGTSCKFAP
ncbi:hypothetical protein KW846_06455 [Pseudomonas sp. PDM32]|uniref:hypothetical protein n=1 Tax=Pseudomonas sp. PDM32 TaxID=2854768 RepID=UPI001C48DB7A|nr:hypothetical protein [Pseudomonas sp. PDM32]MBV7572329.1 hypothetical protein [Pseudomonas sp. PDM32]